MRSSLRANGIYIADPLLRQLAEHPEYLHALVDTMRLQGERIKTLKPKAAYYDAFVALSGGVSIHVAAKQLGGPEGSGRGATAQLTWSRPGGID